MPGTKNDALRNAIIDFIGTRFNGGLLVLYTKAGNEVCTFNLGATIFDGAPSSGSIAATNLNLTDTASEYGPDGIVHATLSRGDGTNPITDLKVGLTGSGAVIELSDSVSPAEGTTITLDSITLTESATVADPA